MVLASEPPQGDGHDEVTQGASCILEHKGPEGLYPWSGFDPRLRLVKGL